MEIRRWVATRYERVRVAYQVACTYASQRAAPEAGCPTAALDSVPAPPYVPSYVTRPNQPVHPQGASSRSVRTVSRLGRVVLVFASLAQLFGVVAGPLEHWRASSRLGAHFESSGRTSTHYVHDEACCVACAITGAVAAPSRRTVELPVAARGRVAVRAATSAPAYPVLRTHAAPRAPPIASLAS